MSFRLQGGPDRTMEDPIEDPREQKDPPVEDPIEPPSDEPSNRVPLEDPPPEDEPIPDESVAVEFSIQSKGTL